MRLWLLPCVLGRDTGGVEVLGLGLVGGDDGGQVQDAGGALGLARSAIVETVSPDSRQEMLEAR